MWDVVAAETWDPRLEGRLASYASASGPSLDHLGSMSDTWRGKLRMLPQTVHSWYVWLFLVPWVPEQMWSRHQWLVRRAARPEALAGLVATFVSRAKPCGEAACRDAP